MLVGNRALYSIDLSINKWKKEDNVSFIKKLTEELNLECTTRKDVKNLEFRFRGDTDYIILDVLNYMKHDNITKISLPVNCFTYPSNKYDMLNGNIFNRFSNLNDFTVTCPKVSNYDYSDFSYNEDVFDKFFQQFSTVKDAKISIESFISSDNTNEKEADHFIEIINIITKHDVKVKLRITVKCPEFGGQCEVCTYTIEHLSPIKQYFTATYGVVTCHKQLLHSIKILETSKNLN
uniref:Radical SAM protein n=1 Tax=Strongyloides venezuelensis TaxID=75913 RepID=A0A0K0F4V8_STRVS